MPREDYDEIKRNFGLFIASWKTKNTDCFDAIIDPQIICYVSTAKSYTCGSQHTIFGIRNFVKDMPKTDVFHSRICTYICRLHGAEAQQYAEVVCLAANHKKEEAVSVFQFTAMFANHWKKTENGWVMNELRMELVKHEGDIPEFEEMWYFEKPTPVWYAGLHYPCISAELDSPWYRIPESEDVLTEEEKIYETLARYTFAIDWDSFGDLRDILSEDVVSVMPRCGAMTKRDWIVNLKFQRMKERCWVHPGKLTALTIQGNKATATYYRMSGHRQRDHEYVYTKKNVDMEHACARYEMELRKEEDGVWRILKNTYYLGFVELGEYTDDLYDDAAWMAEG